ncbi:hypothetical protein GMDG_08653, partial [Pseudogymnoascus destructans 20631-21]
AVHALTQYVLLPVKVAGIEWILKFFIVYGTTSYNMLLGRGWLHQVGAIGDYSTNDYYIFDSAKRPRKVPKVVDVQLPVSLRVHLDDQHLGHYRNSGGEPEHSLKYPLDASIPLEAFTTAPTLLQPASLDSDDEDDDARMTELAERFAKTALLESTHPEYEQEDPRIAQFLAALKQSGNGDGDRYPENLVPI